MRLSKVQMERAAAHLTEHAAGLKCPGCGGNDWSIDEFLFMLVSPPAAIEPGIQVAAAIGRPQAPQPVFSPMITAVCASCFCVVLFAANAMGLLQPAPPPEVWNG